MPFKLLYTVFLSLSAVFHPFHVSVTDIEHDAESQAVQVSQRIFIDDLEVGLKAFHNMERVDTFNPENPDELDSLIGAYLKEKVFFRLNDQDYDFNFLGSEVEGDARWCYYEIEGIASVSKAEITNVTLMEQFDDQQNIVHFKSNDILKSYKLDKDEKFYLFDFTK